MKTFIKLSLLSILGFFTITSSFSCDEGECEAAIELADLTVSALDILNNQIIQSDEVTITNEILNSNLPNICDIVSAFAPESRYSLDFDYRPNNNSEWIESAATALIRIDELAANASQSQNFNFTFEQAGEYRISGVADALNNVVERNEQNNDREFIQSNENSSGRIIYVAPLPSNKATIRNNSFGLLIKPVEGKNTNIESFSSLSLQDVQKNYNQD